MKFLNKALFCVVAAGSMSAAAFADTYNCHVIRQKDGNNHVVESFSLVSKAGDSVDKAVKIEDNYFAVCAIDLSETEASSQWIMCGFVSASGAKLSNKSMSEPLASSSLLSLGGAQFGSASVVGIYTRNGSTDVAICQK